MFSKMARIHADKIKNDPEYANREACWEAFKSVAGEDIQDFNLFYKAGMRPEDISLSVVIHEGDTEVLFASKKGIKVTKEQALSALYKDVISETDKIYHPISDYKLIVSPSLKRAGIDYK